ncbi:unnamed protein product [Prunus brigantina]
MEAQKKGSTKGKRKAESNEQQSRVGRDAFFNFMKKQQHEMGKVANAKLDSKVQKEIANKWRKLNPKEKATYGSALEGSSGQVNDSVNEMGFITRCNPDRFHRTVEKLSNEKRLAINAIGFGNVSSLSCTRLHRQLCQFLIQRFNPDTSSIELHGNVFGISAVEFGRVMGLKNTGDDVELNWPVEDENVKQLVKSFGGNGKRVLVRGLAEQLEKCENADEDFKVRFVMFALGTVLCPTSSPSVTGNYLTFLTIPGKIETKNWANHGFNFLCEGVRSFKAKKVAYVNGSLLFLQLFYFDSIVHGGVYVDKSLDPIVSWDNNSVWKMIKWVRKQGGFDSPTVRAVSEHRPTNEVSGVNLERIVQKVAISLAPVIHAEVQRSVLELIDKVMSQVRSFMKDARQHLHPGHEDVNQIKEDEALKIRDQGGENVVKKKGEECSKLKEKGNSSVASSSSKKRKPAKRISSPMGTGVFGLTLKKIRGCGNNDTCATWYNTAMHDTVKAKVKQAGFLPFLSILGHGKKGDMPLIVALAERWWDTTHTFHFDEVGEMTMTPTDFAAITGLRVGGKRLKYDLEIYKNKNKIVKLFGKPIADLLAGERRVSYESLCTLYWKKNPKDDKEADQIARAFILCLIGSSFLNDKSQYVWACEYLNPFALSRPSGTVNTWPRTLRWVGAKSKRDLQHHLEHFRVMMRHLTNDQVNWNPWGTNESEMPEEVKNTMLATRKRILLEGPAGSTWFLGERVAMQSLGTTEPQVPKIPPRTMFSDYKLTNELEVEEALNGYPASELLANSSDYAQYKDEYIRYRHYEDLLEAEGQHRTPEGANMRVGNISPQPWSMRIPCWAAENGSKLVRIPRGQDSLDLPLPDGVTHVTAEAATEILERNAGLNAVLFSTSLEASIEIRRLRQEIEILKNTSGTTIASSSIGQDVLADDAKHEFRTKFKHDIGRKGKTKIVILEEREEDEEEEEEQEEGQEEEDEEEDEEENEDEAWIKEKEVGDEDEDADEDGAAAKGNPDAEQHSTDQKRKGEKSLRSRTPKRKKTK